MKQKITGKTASKWGQIIAALWVGGWSAFKFIYSAGNISMPDILLSGAGVAACFSPIYASIIIDKIKGVEKDVEGKV